MFGSHVSIFIKDNDTNLDVLKRLWGDNLPNEFAYMSKEGMENRITLTPHWLNSKFNPCVVIQQLQMKEGE